MRLVLSLCALLVVSACGPADTCPSPFAASFHVRDVPLVEGGQVTLELSGTVPEQCVGPFEALSLTGEAVQPGGATGPVRVSNVERGRANGAYVLSADLTFEAPRAGLYEVQLGVDPIGAEVTERITVARAQPAMRAHLATFPEGDCTRPLETALGTLICDNVVLRDGEAVQTLPGFLGIGGNAVWSYDGGRIRRYVDDGDGALRLEPLLPLDAEHPFPPAPGYYEAATETEWVLAHGADVNRFRFAQGDLHEEPALVPFRDVAFDGLIRSGTRVVLHSSLQEVRKLCQLEAPADAALQLAGECTPDEYETFFSDPEGRRAFRCRLGAQGLTSCVLDEPTPAGLSTLGELSVAFTGGFVFEPWRGYQSEASSRGLIPAFVDGELHLEEAVLPDGWALFGLTPTRIVGQHRTLRQVGLFAR